MKKQLTGLMALALLFNIAQAKVKRGEAQSYHTSSHESSATAKHYQEELSKIQASIQAKEAQVERLTQELHRLKENEVKTEALKHIAEKDSVRRTLESHPIAEHSDHHKAKRSNLEYAYNQEN